MSPKPKFLPECAPDAPVFPLEWKEAFYRRNYDHVAGGYVCPGCKKVFSGPGGFRQLHGDHHIPRSKGGMTTWDNLVLLCGKCNLKKRDS